ncbi:MAG: Ycf66 family protein [Cyanobacteriota bacterium]|nr:Ycf66 family protein [Cyanobacteriota bacterium]
MVNASLNWASIVGIVLAVGGALLYFMRSFKPALARDYDVFFAAVGLLCGGILFFQGWRLDPILQFGQFLLAGTTVFFAYESVRLRGVTTEQARRSSYFDDDEPAGPYRPQMGGGSWDGGAERLDEPQPIRRRIRSRDEEEADEFYRPRRATSRAAIPERAASRSSRSDSPEDWDNPAPASRSTAARYSADRSPDRGSSADFGARRRERDARPEPRRGSRMAPGDEAMPRSSRRGPAPGSDPGAAAAAPSANTSPMPRAPQGEPLRSSRDNRDAAGSGSEISDADFRPVGDRSTASRSQGERPRDNSSRFDD